MPTPNVSKNKNGNSPKKQLILNAFVENCSGHQSPGLWRHPDDESSDFNNIHHWIKLAKLLESAKFHGMFIADVVGGYDVYQGPRNLSAAVKSGAQWPVNEPLALVPAMAAATESLGFGFTVATTYEQLYHLARRISTVDHLTGGRVGWNIVTGYLDSAARNLGATEQPEHDERYAIAEEYLRVMYKLWQASWRDDAVVLNRETGVYSNQHAYGRSIMLGNMTGIFTVSALPALVGTFFSSRQGALAATASIWTGFFAAVITWLTLAQRFSGTVSIAPVGATDPCLYGCIAGIGAAAVVTISVSIFHNANYGWETLGEIRLIDDAGNDRDVAYADPTYDPKRLRRAAYVARGITIFLFLALFIIWPLTFYGTAYMFSKKFFTGWVIVSLLWAFFSFFSVTVFPIIEGRHLLLSWAKDLFGKGSKGQHRDEFDHHQHRQRYDESDGSATASKEKENINESAVPVAVKNLEDIA